MAWGMIDPGESAEVADLSSDYTFNADIRYFKAGRAGTLKVDMRLTGESISIPVVQGVNPERISKIYISGDTMSIVGFW